VFLKTVGNFCQLVSLEKRVLIVLPLLVEAMASVISVQVFPFFMSNSENKCGGRVKVRSLSNADSTVLSSDSIVVNGHLRSKIEGKKRVKDDVMDFEAIVG
jgi:hypothetical protein